MHLRLPNAWQDRSSRFQEAAARVRRRSLRQNIQTAINYIKEEWLFAAWVAALLAIMWIALVPTDALAQLVMSALILLVLVFVRREKLPVMVREVFLFLAAYLSLRYFFWRTTQTLVYYGPASFTAAILLYLAEVYGIVIYLLGLFVNIRPMDRASAPLPANLDDFPTVDIFIPSYNEGSDIIELTLFSAVQINYPRSKYKIHLCDDGGTDQKCNDANPQKAKAAQDRRAELIAMCKRIGAVYHTRAKNLHAKAGNLNSAFQNTNGDLVMILDVDHVPTRDILERTVGLFLQDPKLFLVQSPHFFLNPDPIEKNLDTFKVMPNESEMFYSIIQRGLDFWNAAFFCGSAALLRRKFLEEQGGIAGETITEDAETALGLHTKGYHSAYIQRPMVAGLSPETLGGFMVQRTRWAQGMVQIFILKNPMLLPGLTIYQRLCYLNCCFFWFFGYSRMVYMLAPLFFLVFGLKIYAANVTEFFAYAVPHMLAAMFISDFLYGRVRWSFISELYELVQAPYTLPAILQVIWKPRAPEFAVTPKGEQLDKDFISQLAKPFYFLLTVTIFGMGVGVWRYTQFPIERPVTVITLAWCCLNLVMLFGVIGVLYERRQRRAYPRFPEDLKTEMEVGGVKVPLHVTELSLGGILAEVPAEAFKTLETDATVRLKVPAFRGDGPANIFNMTIFRKRLDHGQPVLVLKFADTADEQRKAAVGWLYGSSDRWVKFQQDRAKYIGIKKSLLFITMSGLKHSYGHLMYVITSGLLVVRDFTGRILGVPVNR